MLIGFHILPQTGMEHKQLRRHKVKQHKRKADDHQANLHKSNKSQRQIENRQTMTIIVLFRNGKHFREKMDTFRENASFSKKERNELRPKNKYMYVSGFRYGRSA